MMKFGLSIGLMLVMLLGTQSEPAAGTYNIGQIKWISFDEARKQTNNGRKFLFYFHANWCTYCHKLEKDVFTKNDIIDYINSNYMPVRINSDKEKKLAARYGVRGLPNLQFRTPEGEAIARWPGYIEADRLMIMLQFIGTDSYKTMSYNDFVKQQKGK